MNSLDFSAFHLVIGDDIPKIDILNKIFIEKEDVFDHKATHYSITKEIRENEYFWFYAKYGSTFPYSPTVYNKENLKEEPNPRSTNQIETAKQFFALYSFKDKVLYLSNTQKKNILEDYLKFKLNLDVVIKRLLKTAEEFLDQIKTIEKIKFVAKSHLFTYESEIMKIFPNPNDLFGLGMPGSFTLEAKFLNSNKTAKFEEFLKKLVGWKNSSEADNLLCIGRDDNDFETIFNAESFIQKLTIQIEKSELGMSDETLICDELIRKIKEKQNA